MRKSNSEEFKIQADFIQYIKLKYPDLLYTISPAGFIMSAGMAMKMMRMGYRKGTPDVLFFEPRGLYHGLLIEFKAPGGVISDDQTAFVHAAEKRGFCCAFCFSKDRALGILEEYLFQSL